MHACIVQFSSVYCFIVLLYKSRKKTNYLNTNGEEATGLIRNSPPQFVCFTISNKNKGLLVVWVIG